MLATRAFGRDSVERQSIVVVTRIVTYLSHEDEGEPWRECDLMVDGRQFDFGQHQREVEEFVDLPHEAIRGHSVPVLADASPTGRGPIVLELGNVNDGLPLVANAASSMFDIRMTDHGSVRARRASKAPLSLSTARFEVALCDVETLAARWQLGHALEQEHPLDLKLVLHVIRDRRSAHWATKSASASLRFTLARMCDSVVAMMGGTLAQ